MKDVLVKRETLIQILKDTLEKHKTDLEKSLADYREKAIESSIK